MSSIQLFDLNGEQRFTGTSVGGGGSQPSAATVRLSGTASGLVNGETIPFDTAIADTDGYFDPVTHLFTIPAGKGGLFLVGAQATPDTPIGSTWSQVVVFLSGFDVNIAQGVVQVAAAKAGDAVALVSLADGDTLTCAMLFDGGGTIQLTTLTAFWLIKVT